MSLIIDGLRHSSEAALWFYFAWPLLNSTPIRTVGGTYLQLFCLLIEYLATLVVSTNGEGRNQKYVGGLSTNAGLSCALYILFSADWIVVANEADGDLIWAYTANIN